MNNDDQNSNQLQDEQMKETPKRNPAKLVRRKRNQYSIDTATGVTYLKVISKEETIRTAIDGPLMTTIDLLTWSVVRGEYGIYFQSMLPEADGGRDAIRLHELVYLMRDRVPVPGSVPDHIHVDPQNIDRTLYFKIERVRSTGLVVDHKDRNPLNNRASNVRLLPAQLNTMNSDRCTNGSSRYPGVSFHKVAGNFRAITTINGDQNILGHRDTQEEAAALVLAKLMEIYPNLDWETLAEEFFPGIPMPKK